MDEKYLDNKTSAALHRHDQAGLLCITLLTHPTLAGVSASYAFLGDIIIAEPRAMIGFTGARVIEQTIKKKLPEGFQESEFLLEHGQIDMVVERKNLCDIFAKIISFTEPQNFSSLLEDAAGPEAERLGATASNADTASGNRCAQPRGQAAARNVCLCGRQGGGTKGCNGSAQGRDPLAGQSVVLPGGGRRKQDCASADSDRHSSRDEVEVVSGLSGSERVIATNVAAYREGQTVEIVPPATK